ncbi:MAG: hypothetical protein HOP33_08910 [Verrucomicrobia bacterium]|nr:hypothetical protein [Verrucomicrobiota bacterium]
MKLHCRPETRSGYALLVVLVLGTAAILVFSSTLRRTTTVSKLNERNNSWVKSINAAEAATEKVIARMRYDYVYGQDAFVTNNLATYRTYVPTAAENSYWGNFEFSDGLGNVGRTYVKPITTRVYTNLSSQYTGLNGFQTIYRVMSNVRPTIGTYPTSAAVQQDVETDSIPVFQFAIFYNGLLEFSTAATMTVRGRTHANANIYTGSGSQLTFNGTVTTSGTISSPANAGGTPPWTYTGTYNGSPTYRTNVPVLNLPVGTNNTAAAVHAIIEMPPSSEDVTSPLGQQRYYNKAHVVMLVSNDTVTAMIKNDIGDTPITVSVPTWGTNSPQLRTNFPFLSITNQFKERREGTKSNYLTQIDVKRYNEWLLSDSNIATKFATSGKYPNIAYVADNRTPSSTVLYSVRLTNGVAIPTNGTTGFTLATPNPLYVWDNYNCPISANLGTTNTAGTQPASFACDAFTVLSRNWSDSASYGSYGSQANAISTTVNACMITGVVPSTGITTSTFSGGVHNLPRLLENWSSSGVTLTLNTSIVCLFNSTMATNKFIWPGTTYNPPSRNFNFDPNLANIARQPPGTPMLSVILRSTWRNPPLNTTNYAGL